MDFLPKDVLLMMAIDDMDYQTVLRLCQTNTRYNTILCNNPDFWRRKLQRDYPNLNIENVTNYRGLYASLRKFVRNEFFSDAKNLFKFLGPIDNLGYGIRTVDKQFKIVDDDIGTISRKILSCTQFSMNDIIEVIQRITGIHDNNYDDFNLIELCNILLETFKLKKRFLDLSKN